jgi:hypothetical protein
MTPIGVGPKCHHIYHYGSLFTGGLDFDIGIPLTLWMIAKPSVKNSPSSILQGILLSDVPSGNQIQAGYTRLFK